MHATSVLFVSAALAILPARIEPAKVPVTIAGTAADHWYCAKADTVNEGVLHLRYHLTITNTGSRPLILARQLRWPMSWDIAHSMSKAHAGEFAVRNSHTLFIVGSAEGMEPDPSSLPPRVKRAATPDEEQFQVLPPGGSAVAEVPHALTVDIGSRPSGRLSAGHDYVIRLTVNLWPFNETSAAHDELQALWNEVGLLAEGTAETDFIVLSTPHAQRFPLCDKTGGP